MFQSLQELQAALDPYLSPTSNKDLHLLQESVIDRLVQTAIFSDTEEIKRQARQGIRDLAKRQGAYSASIHNLYQAIGKDTIKGFTIPAINIRGLTYDTARVIFRLMQREQVGAVIMEIARSEMEYTAQRPNEYAVSILAAAIKENYKGPIFLQGDHFQLSAKKFAADKTAEIQKIKDLTKEAIDAEFFNIDIDASTLVDLTQTDLSEQQRNNYEVSGEITSYIRSLQPKGIAISIGGEIGHIGGRNSTVEDFTAFMEGFLPRIKGAGISKVSVQTGTSHGGTPDANGKVVDVKLDFSVLQNIGQVAREKYGLGGAVQHGASTLPNDLFNRFPEVRTLEIHLATGFQNIIYDHLPEKLKQEMYQWCKENAKQDREEGWTDEQFIYKTRKKAIGPFKKQLWQLPDADKQPIIKALEDQLLLLFTKLKMQNTKEGIDKYILSEN